MKEKKYYFTEAIALILSLLILIPVYMLIVGSFKTSPEASELSLRLPTTWNIVENYSQLFERSKIPLAFFNSLVISSCTVVLTIILGSMAAFIFQRRKSKLSGILFSLFMIGLVVPGNIIVTYYIIKMAGLYNTHLGAILVYVNGHLPLTIFLYFGYFKSISKEIDESAIVDGANIITLFYRIIFPLVKPVSATVAILVFMGVWNDFSYAIYFLTNPKLQTLVLQTYSFFGEKRSDWNLVFANVVLVSLPVVILYLFLQRYIVDGFAAGAVKG